MQPPEPNTAPDSPVVRPERDPIWLAANDIGRAFGETDRQVFRLIRRMIRARGEPFVRELVQKTHEVEAGGGMFSEKEQRRRTIGGVFFVLAKQAFGAEWWKIDPFRKRPQPANAESAASSPPKTATSTTDAEPTRRLSKTTTWEEGLAAARTATVQSGEARTVKITLIGRPGRVEKRDACIVTSMESTKAPSLPKGLPPTPTTPTRYAVFIATKQWNKVESALASNPEDQLVIEGFAAFVPELGSMGVFAANTTTVFLQRAKKAPAAQSDAG